MPAGAQMAEPGVALGRVTAAEGEVVGPHLGAEVGAQAGLSAFLVAEDVGGDGVVEERPRQLGGHGVDVVIGGSPDNGQGSFENHDRVDGGRGPGHSPPGRRRVARPRAPSAGATVGGARATLSLARREWRRADWPACRSGPRCLKASAAPRCVSVRAHAASDPTVSSGDPSARYRGNVRRGRTSLLHAHGVARPDDRRVLRIGILGAARIAPTALDQAGPADRGGRGRRRGGARPRAAPPNSPASTAFPGSSGSYEELVQRSRDRRRLQPAPQRPARVLDHRRPQGRQARPVREALHGQRRRGPSRGRGGQRQPRRWSSWRPSTTSTTR